jgi:hypothetical protein
VSVAALHSLEISTGCGGKLSTSIPSHWGVTVPLPISAVDPDFFCVLTVPFTMWYTRRPSHILLDIGSIAVASLCGRPVFGSPRCLSAIWQNFASTKI